MTEHPSPYDGLCRNAVRIAWQADLPADVDGASRPGDPPVILLSKKLDQVQRRCVLAHELAHLARGGGSEHPDPVVRQREERRVDQIAATHLVPADELAAWLDRRGDDPTTAADVADEFRVTPDFAQIALRQQAGGTS